MESFVDAHYFPTPTQGNIYSVVNLTLSNGTNKTLVATLKRKVYSCEFLDVNYKIIPKIKEVPFTYIPSNAEIVSIDAFNRSKTFDDFFIGITIIKVNADKSTETYLNIYTEQDADGRSELNLDCLSQNCLMLELSFIPYQLFHTSLFTNIEKYEEKVWLLSGSDLKMHLFREDPQHHTYNEIEPVDLFPEFSFLPSVVLWVDIEHTSSRERRLTVIGCECGLVKIYIVDILTNFLLLNLSYQFNGPISRIMLFKVRNKPLQLKSSRFGKLMKLCEHNQESPFNLLVVNSLQSSVVFMDVFNQHFNHKLVLPGSDQYDVALCACKADIDMDSKAELLIGTYSKKLLIYKYIDDIWVLLHQHTFSHSIHSILYVDITGDGIKELIVVTMLGIQILQHNLLAVMKKLKENLQHVTMDEV